MEKSGVRRKKIDFTLRRLTNRSVFSLGSLELLTIFSEPPLTFLPFNTKNIYIYKGFTLHCFLCFLCFHALSLFHAWRDYYMLPKSIQLFLFISYLVTLNMSKPIARLSRQSETTWATFHRRVSSMSFDYSKLLPEPVFAFLDHKAKSLGSSTGYVVPSLLTCTAFLLASNNANLLLGTYIQPPNLYTMFVGHPVTGKSPAIDTLL